MHESVTKTWDYQSWFITSQKILDTAIGFQIEIGPVNSHEVRKKLDAVAVVDTPC